MITLSRCWMAGDKRRMHKHYLKPRGSHRSKCGVLMPSSHNQRDVAGRRGRSRPAYSQRQIAKAIRECKACMACEQWSHESFISQDVSCTLDCGDLDVMPCTQTLPSPDTICARAAFRHTNLISMMACCPTMQLTFMPLKYTCLMTSGRSESHAVSRHLLGSHHGSVQSRRLCSVQMSM